MVAVELPERDKDFLDEKGFNYELVEFPGGIYLIINDFPFPAAYTPRLAKVLIVIPTGYPEAKVDMIFTIPDVKLVNGQWPQNCEQHVPHNNLTWQQWSRHINWRIGVDNLRTFMTAMKKELDLGR